MDFAAGVYLSEAQNPIPPPLTHCICTCKRYTFYTGKWGKGGGESQRGLQGRVQSTKLSWKYARNIQTINSDKHLPQSPFKIKIFLDDDILHWILWVLFLRFQSRLCTKVPVNKLERWKDVNTVKDIYYICTSNPGLTLILFPLMLGRRKASIVKS